MAITPLPTPPTTSDPANFQTRADAFVAALVQFVAEINAALVSIPYIPGQREVLTGNRTYYVRTDGSDSNNGLSNASSGAFLTLQRAHDVACRLDFAGYTVTIKVGPGIYTAGVGLSSSWVGGGTLLTEGDTASPNAVQVTTTSASGFWNTAPLAGVWIIRGFSISQTTAGYGLRNSATGSMVFSSIIFGLSAQGHIFSDGGGYIRANGNYNVVAAAPFHLMSTSRGGVQLDAITLLINNDPVWATAFAVSSRLGLIEAFSCTFTGNSTGSRYNASTNGVIYTGGTTLPGNASGATATGGQYA